MTEQQGRVLAVDWGEKRFGIAISDPLRLFAQPLKTLTRRSGKRAPISDILELVTANEVTEIVVGLPLSADGTEERPAREARTLGQSLQLRSGLPVHFQDERMSTARAQAAAKELGVKHRDAKARMDQMAAVGILQTWLDRA